jgi:hypothetical protein
VIHIGAWAWGAKYPDHYRRRLEASVARNFSGEYRFHVWTPRAEDRHLTKVQGCFARLRAFSPEWQAEQGIAPGDLIVNLDLDLIVTGPLDGLFDPAADFTILQGVNATNPCPYNGSVWALRAGYRPDVWSDFTLDAAARVPFYAFPDDQAWFADRMPGAAAIGPAQGVYAFKKPGWPRGVDLPDGARIVAFPGHRDPAQFTWVPWVAEAWSE